MLSDRQIRTTSATGKAFKLFDGLGLLLLVSAAGSKLWRFRYRIGGAEKLLALGAYPEVTLARAREARDAARALLRDGRDPGVEKKLRKAAGAAGKADTLEAVARAWHATQADQWTPTHARDVLNSLELYVFPTLGALPLREISAPMLLKVLRAIEARPAVETAHRVRQRVSAVFLYGIAEGACAEDPAGVLKPAMKPVQRGRQPAIVELVPARKILADAEAIPAHPTTKLALRLLALTALRLGELRGARWEEFEDLDGAEPLWRVPAERMKMKVGHLVPLAPQAVEVIRAVRPLTGRYPMVFPNVRSAHQPISEATVNKLLHRSGYEDRHVPHGWRSAFSTIMNERHRADRAVIDLMLAHAPKDRVEAAYNRATHRPRRRELAREWADLILDGRPPAATLLSGPRR